MTKKKNADRIHEQISAYPLEECVARLQALNRGAMRVTGGAVDADDTYLFNITHDAYGRMWVTLHRDGAYTRVRYQARLHQGWVMLLFAPGICCAPLLVIVLPIWLGMYTGFRQTLVQQVLRQFGDLVAFEETDEQAVIEGEYNDGQAKRRQR
jgi:hypothetical protein